MSSVRPLEKAAAVAVTTARETSRVAAGRATVTTMRLFNRLAQPPVKNAAPVWSAHVTSIVIGGVCATLLASAFDPFVQPAAALSDHALLRFLASVTDAAKSGWYIVPAIMVIAIIGLLDWGAVRHGSRRALAAAYGQAFFILAAVAIPGIGVNIAKQFFGRARPRMMEEVGIFSFQPFQFDSAFQSFPSGHSTTAGSLAVILILFHPRWRWPAIVAMFVLACTRLPAGAHYPADVVAGYTFGVVGALLVARWLARRRLVFSLRSNGALPVLLH